MKILSLIVPAYNSEQFLDKVIGSFLNAGVLEKLDIIIVDDGSTDATGEIAQRYAQAYPHAISVISQENRGHGGALNAGCAAAVGKFLKVIDADDWVIPENLAEFVRLLEGCESDVVLTHHHTVDIATGEVKCWRSYPPQFGRAYTLAEIMPQWKNFDRSLSFHGITYNTAFYRKHALALSEHVFYEDHEFATYPCCHAKSITPLDLFAYEYRVGDVQQSVSEGNQLRRISHTETVLHRIAGDFYPRAGSAAAQGYVARKACGLLISYLTTAMLVEPDKKRGRELAGSMMAYFRAACPEAAVLAEKQYAVFTVLNRLRISRAAFERVLRSRIYNTLRRNHDFE